MNLVQIEGNEELFKRLGTIEDVTFANGVTRDEATGHFVMGAYASDEAIEAIRALGGVIKVLKDNTQLEEHFEQFYGYPDNDDIS